MRTGEAISAASNPTPWLTLFAISSPTDCGRSKGACGDRAPTSSYRPLNAGVRFSMNAVRPSL